MARRLSYELKSRSSEMTIEASLSSCVGAKGMCRVARRCPHARQRLERSRAHNNSWRCRMYSGTVGRCCAGALAQPLHCGAHDCIAASVSTGGRVDATESSLDAPMLQLSTTVAEEVTSSVVKESQQHEVASMADGPDSPGVADRMSAGGVQQHARMTAPVYRHTINVSGRATSWLEKRSARRRASGFIVR